MTNKKLIYFLTIVKRRQVYIMRKSNWLNSTEGPTLEKKFTNRTQQKMYFTDLGKGKKEGTFYKRCSVTVLVWDYKCIGGYEVSYFLRGRFWKDFITNQTDLLGSERWCLNSTSNTKEYLFVRSTLP